MLVRVKKTQGNTPDNACHIICRDGTEIIVSPEDYLHLFHFQWSMKKSFCRSYAGRWITIHGKRKFLYMHRLIVGCSPDNVVHHFDNNPLNNQRENLGEFTPYEHKEYFSYR